VTPQVNSDAVARRASRQIPPDDPGAKPADAKPQKPADDQPKKGLLHRIIGVFKK
jgi:hypothetical protein